MWRGLLVAIPLFGLSRGLYGVESGEQTMTIVSAEQKTRDRIVAWVVDTPIYQQDPYFSVAVRVGETLFEGEYEPQHPWETLPVFWKPGVQVQGRVSGHSLFLKRPNGLDIRFVILKRSVVREKTAVDIQR